MCYKIKNGHFLKNKKNILYDKKNFEVSQNEKRFVVFFFKQLNLIFLMKRIRKNYLIIRKRIRRKKIYHFAGSDAKQDKNFKREMLTIILVNGLVAENSFSGC